MIGCGCERPGVIISNGCEIQRCDECGLLPDDDEAVAVVDKLLRVLHAELDGGGSVHEALERLQQSAQRARTAEELVKRFANEEWSADYPTSNCLYPTMEEITLVVGPPPRGVS